MTAYIDTSDPKQLDLLDANTLMALEIITDIASRTVTIIILAFWLNLATKPSQHQHTFWRWFAVSSVIIFPAVIGDLASYVSVLLKHGEVMIYAADLNSLNGLLKLPPDHAWSQFASSFPLLMPWYIALGYGAVATWTEFQRDQALVISALPWVGYYFIWALYILIF
jgi:energy-converting hydrogenase Eha subunit A